MKRKTEPLPCPFCGKQPKLWQNTEDFGLMGDNIPTDWIISCCVEMSGMVRGKVLRKWNNQRGVKKAVEEERAACARIAEITALETDDVTVETTAYEIVILIRGRK